uniref:Uncharacterized protein n=1 Tax=Parascaris equorum TaxID=6256 RepID=A0A914R3F1_PAREQ
MLLRALWSFVHSISAIVRFDRFLLRCSIGAGLFSLPILKSL